MDTYAQVLALLDSHYSHIEAWERIVYSYRVVEYCKAMGYIVPSEIVALNVRLQECEKWWMERILENVI